MTIEELREKKNEMEQKIASAMKEFQEATHIEIGIEKDFNYNIGSQIKL